MSVPSEHTNGDFAPKRGFGREWSAYDQSGLAAENYERTVQACFRLFSLAALPPHPDGFDVGCGSGRWAAGGVDKVGHLRCIER